MTKKQMKTEKTQQVEKLNVPHLNKIKLNGFSAHKLKLDLGNTKKIHRELMAFFKEGEYEAFMDLLELYIDYVGKRKLSSITKIPERSIYNFKDKKHKTSAENIFRIMKAIGQLAA